LDASSGRFWKIGLSCGWATTAKGADMNEHLTTLDQTDEDILTYDVSDEALEAAAGRERGVVLRAQAISQFGQTDNLFSCCVV
jgi:hypothetical protein